MKQLMMACLFLQLLSISAKAYRIEADSYYLGGGFGVNINAVRLKDSRRATPKAEMPIIAHLDYAIDRNWGVFGSFIPQFGAGSIGFGFRGGAKYWFSFFDAPYVPYVALALTPTFLFPVGEVPNHFNIGISPGVGMNFFVLAKFIVGAHVFVNPTLAFVDKTRKFEFSVMTFFDVTLKV